MTAAGLVAAGFVGGVGTSVAAYLCFLAWALGPRERR
jgi:hypothetical protein